ncbi:MAG: hypothetical protein HKM89_15720 [Gemmatimonadales bacterium]|nr:hypothetical protein [Gemmatimonadales bacterium]
MMKPHRLRRLAFWATAPLVVLATLFYTLYRPWALSWGATDQEVARPMVGDGIVEQPTFDATRAVTINAPAARIWPWLVQMGYQRAGFYSWDLLDNAGIPSAERILPQFQGLKVGDLVPLSDDADAEVVALEPDSTLLLVFRSGETFTWAWGLYQIDAEHTRLISRLRWRATGVFSRFILDPFEIIMMRKCLLGIKRRAEARMDST